MAQNSVQKDVKRESDQQSLFAGILNINGIQVINKNIQLLEIKEWVLQVLPRLEVIFDDPKIFFDFAPIQENDIVDFSFSLNSDTEEIISMKFRMLDHDNDITNANMSTIRFTSYYSADKIFNPIFNRAFKGNSSEVIAKLATEMGLKSVIKVNSNDNMTWYQLNITNFDMINHLSNRAFVANDDAVFVYINRKGELVYTSLKTELEKEPIIKLVYNENRKAPDENSDGTGKNKNKQSNVKEDNTLYYDSIKYFNRSGYINKVIGYGKEYSFLSKDELKKEKVENDSPIFTDYSYKDKENVGLTVQHQYFGALSGNMHDNYYKAIVQNQYFKATYFNSPILVPIDPTDKLNLFDIVDLMVPKGRDGELNESYSGKYIVGGIHFYLNNKQTPSMLLVLFRNGINKNSYIEEESWHLNK